MKRAIDKAKRLLQQPVKTVKFADSRDNASKYGLDSDLDEGNEMTQNVHYNKLERERKAALLAEQQLVRRRRKTTNMALCNAHKLARQNKNKQVRKWMT